MVFHKNIKLYDIGSRLRTNLVEPALKWYFIKILISMYLVNPTGDWNNLIKERTLKLGTL